MDHGSKEMRLRREVDVVSWHLSRRARPAVLVPSRRRLLGQLQPRAPAWPRRPLHGDAHTNNVPVTSGGPLFIDFEDVCVGPPEWDLADLTAEAVAA